MFPHHPDHPAQSLGKAQPKCVLLRWSGRRRSGKCLIPYAFRQRGCYPKDFLWHVEHPETLLGSISLDTNFPSPALLSLMCLFSVWQRSDRGSYPLTRAKAAGGGQNPYFFRPPPIHLAGVWPSLHISALSCCWEGQQNGSEEKKPSKVAHPTRVTCCLGWPWSRD